jgi:diphosphomevalonate decarboxylase
MSTVAAAIAHPNIALVKYWGKRNAELNLPATPSVSLTVAPFSTRTTVEWGAEQDAVVLNGAPAAAGARDRVLRFLDLVDPRRPPCAVRSDNEFPTGAGLASSSSAFAALALAATRAAGRSLDPAALSVLARRGSGSACRSIWGGFVRWPLGSRADGLDSYGIPLASDWELAMVAVLVASEEKETSSRDGMARTERTSPMYAEWVASAPVDYAAALDAIAARDLEALGTAMERSTFKMHATMETADPPLRYLRPQSFEVTRRIEALRAAGTAAWVTMDAGPNVKVLCSPMDVDAVRAALADLALPTQVLRAGGGARWTEP